MYTLAANNLELFFFFILIKILLILLSNPYIFDIIYSNIDIINVYENKILIYYKEFT